MEEELMSAFQLEGPKLCASFTEGDCFDAHS